MNTNFVVKRYKLVFTCIICLSFFSFETYSQRVRTVPTNAIEGMRKNKTWYDSASTWSFPYALQLPLIPSLPPIHTGMPYEVLLGYIGADSIARNISYSNSILEDFWNNSTTMNDTIRIAVKHLYKMQQYDPIMWMQFSNEVDFKGDTNYIAPLSAHEYDLNKKFLSLLDTDTSYKASTDMYRALLFSSYILRIKVHSIDSTSYDRYNATNPYYKYGVVAEVIDTLKGAIFQEYIFPNNTEIESTQSGQNKKYIQFVYDTKVDTNPVMSEYLPQKFDSLFIDTNTRKMRLHPGQELIVFLEYGAAAFNTTHDFLQLRVSPSYAVGLPFLPNGNLRDVNGLFFSNNEGTYQEFVQHLEDAISDIRMID